MPRTSKRSRKKRSKRARRRSKREETYGNAAAALGVGVFLGGSVASYGVYRVLKKKAKEQADRNLLIELQRKYDVIEKKKEINQLLNSMNQNKEVEVDEILNFYKRVDDATTLAALTEIEKDLTKLQQHAT